MKYETKKQKKERIVGMTQEEYEASEDLSEVLVVIDDDGEVIDYFVEQNLFSVEGELKDYYRNGFFLVVDDNLWDGCGEYGDEQIEKFEKIMEENEYIIDVVKKYLVTKQVEVPEEEVCTKEGYPDFDNDKKNDFEQAIFKKFITEIKETIGREPETWFENGNDGYNEYNWNGLKDQYGDKILIFENTTKFLLTDSEVEKLKEKGDFKVEKKR